MWRVAPVFLLAAAIALAGEKSVAPAADPAPAAEDALAAAKRDFETVKAARSPAEQARPDLLRLTAPEFPAAAPAAPRPPATPAELAARKKSANWLVDAMMKKTPQDPRAKVTGDLENPPGGAGKAEGDDTTGHAKTDPMPGSGKPAGPEFNPLARYMVGWMTPQDYALLKPGLGGEVASDLATRGDPSLAALAPGDTGSTLDFSSLGKGALRSPPGPQENPYLPGLAISPPAGALFTPPATANATPSPRAGPVTPPPEPAPVKSKTPDFAKPADDAKYFKQLKRF